MHPCERCGAPILEKYRICFLCMRDAQESQKPVYNAQRGVNPTYTAPEGVCAPERKETPYTRRPEGSGEPHMTWEEAHAENMESSKALCASFKSLTEAIGNLTIVINWLVDQKTEVEHEVSIRPGPGRKHPDDEPEVEKR